MEKHDAIAFLRGLPGIKSSAMAQSVVDKLDEAGLKIKEAAGDIHEEAQPVISKAMESARSARDTIDEIIGRGFHIGSK